MKALVTAAAMVAATATAGGLVLGTGSSASAAPVTCGLAAHRGDHTGASENSRNAMVAAIDDGADYLEIDVRASKDKHLFLMHDKTVDRTTDGTGYIRDMTKSQVRALHLGDGELVPYLGGVLALAKPTGVHVLLEIKSMGGRATFLDLAHQVRSFGIHRIRVTSLNPTRLNRLHAIAPDIKELLITDRQVTPAEVAPYGAVAISSGAVTRPWLDQMPYPTFVYVANTVAEWDLVANTASGVITDNPVAFANYRKAACA